MKVIDMNMERKEKVTVTYWSNPADILDFERAATTIHLGDCRRGLCVNGGSRTEIEVSKGTEGGYTGRVGHGSARK